MYTNLCFKPILPIISLEIFPLGLLVFSRETVCFAFFTYSPRNFGNPPLSPFRKTGGAPEDREIWEACNHEYFK